MRLQYDKDDDDDEMIPDINDSDIADMLSDQDNYDKQKQQPPMQAKEEKEVWFQRQQNKSHNVNINNNKFNSNAYKLNELKDSLENDNFNQDLNESNIEGPDFLFEEEKKSHRPMPNNFSSDVSNIRSGKNGGGGGINLKFGPREPGGKPQLLPAPRIEMKSDELLKKQHQFKAETGHTVYFPFKPYQCQVDFMSKVIKALNNGENALLESPTGTGKTLSLLCASLAWLKEQREKAGALAQQFDAPRIIYTSRTHSQLAQVQKELKNTGYNPRSVIIGSRDHLCVHPEIKLLKVIIQIILFFQGHALNVACKKAQKSLNPCAYGKNRDIAVKQLPWEPLDIEELHKIADQLIICPYFASKDRIHGADIIFMPYNYLIDEKIRENFEVNYKGSCIIFDEGHNASSTAEDVVSFELVAKTLEQAMTEIERLQDERKVQEDNIQFKSSEEDTSCLLLMTRAFHRYLEDYDIDQSKVPNFRIDQQYLREGSVVMPGHYIFDIFRAGTEYYGKWMQAFDNALTDIGTQTWFDIIKRVLRLYARSNKAKKMKVDVKENDDADEFYVYVYDEEDQSNNQLQFNKGKRKGPNVFVQKTWMRTLAFWCFNAGIGFRDIQELMPRSIILTSGTLTPLNSFQAELQLQFNQRLENPHVISPDQVSINILTRGIRESAFNFSFQNRDNENALVDLGLTIASIAEVTPGGMLVFFPSYRVLQKCDEIWQNSHVKPVMEKYKKVFLEPKDPSKYQATMDKYYNSIFKDGKHQKKKTQKAGSETEGAILMGVCRGRISEGLDFSDNAARCVIVVGIPYPQMTDPKVILKKNFLDMRANLMRGQKQDYTPLSGRDWYSQQATRAVNQAIGRVIRHVQDYGSIILIDERYGWGSMRSQISKWLRDRIKVHNKCQDMNSSLQQFFQQMSEKGFKAKVEQLGQVQIEMDPENDGLPKKIDPMSSEDEDAKANLGFVNNIFNKKVVTNTKEEPTYNQLKGTLSRFFDKKGSTNQIQKRTLADIEDKSNGEVIKPSKKTKIDLSNKVFNNSKNSQKSQLSIVHTSASNKNKLGYINDEENSAETIQPQEFGLRYNKSAQGNDFQKASDALGMGRNNNNRDQSPINQLDGFSYKANKSGNQSKQMTRQSTKNDYNSFGEINNSNYGIVQELKGNNNSSSSGGIYSTDVQKIEDKKERNKSLIDGFKKILDKSDLIKLPNIIKDLKTQPSVIQPFNSLRETIFGKIKNVKSDKNHGEKLRLMKELGELMPKNKHEEYSKLMRELSSN